MQLKNSPYISYAGTPVREVWLNSTLVWSFSGYNWVNRNLAQGAWSDVAYGPLNQLVVVGNNRSQYSTDNGNTWGGQILPINSDAGTEIYNALAYGNGTWSLLESLTYSPFASRYCYTSTNILTGWTRHTLTQEVSGLSFMDMIYSQYHNKFIASGDNTAYSTLYSIGAYSTDGINWLSAGYFDQSGVPQNGTQAINSLVEGTSMPNNRLVGCGGTGNAKFTYSNNGGTTWIKGTYNPNSLGQNLQSGGGWNQVTYGSNNSTLPLSGRYVAVNVSGSTGTYQFAYSNNGIDWIGVSYSSTALKRNWRSVAFANGDFVALSDTEGYQAISKDGINWVAFKNVPTTSPLFDITVANNRFVAIAYNNAGGNNIVTANF